MLINQSSTIGLEPLCRLFLSTGKVSLDNLRRPPLSAPTPPRQRGLDDLRNVAVSVDVARFATLRTIPHYQITVRSPTESVGAAALEVNGCKAPYAEQRLGSSANREPHRQKPSHLTTA